MRASLTSKSSSSVQRPRRAVALAERVARLVDRLEHRLQVGVELALLDQTPAQLVDDRRLLDPHRAASTQALHCMHDQTVSVRTPSCADNASVGKPRPRRSVAVRAAPPSRPPDAQHPPQGAFDCSRSSRTTSRGDSGRPVALAGQASWQRPHLVQASSCSRCSGLKSASVAVPGRLGGALGRDRREPLARERIAQRQRQVAGDHVRRLGVGDAGHERDRQQAVEPPQPVPQPRQRRCRLRAAKRLGDDPAAELGAAVAGVAHRDPHPLQHEARQRDHQQDRPRTPSRPPGTFVARTAASPGARSGRA